MNVSNKILLNVAKCQGYSIYRFWIINGKPTGRGGGGVKLPLPRHIPRLITCKNFDNHQVLVIVTFVSGWTFSSSGYSEISIFYFISFFVFCFYQWTQGDFLYAKETLGYIHLVYAQNYTFVHIINQLRGVS